MISLDDDIFIYRKLRSVLCISCENGNGNVFRTIFTLSFRIFLPLIRNVFIIYFLLQLNLYMYIYIYINVRVYVCVRVP